MGTLNIKKPSGPTSFAAVDAVRRTLGAKKAGHIGTLDPSAEGVLPICLNQSTKIIQFLNGLDKRYRAVLKLGEETDTQDALGKIVSINDSSAITSNDLQEILAEFVGEIIQIPPMHSAKKKDGIRLYRLARKGVTVERNPVRVKVYALEFYEKKGDEVEIEVHCSSGTYIRTLCHDIGRRLGCGGHMKSLLRTQVGRFDLKDAVTPEQLDDAVQEGNANRFLLSAEEVLGFLPEATVREDRVIPVTQGRPLSKEFFETLPNRFKPGMNIRVLRPDHTLLAIAEPLTDQDAFVQLAPKSVAFKLKRVFN